MIDKIDLKILETLSKGTVSGESLSQNLNITRTAVWKRINKLKEYGYKITSSPKGYVLKGRSDYLLPNEVKPYMKTSFIGKKYLFFKEINSTNKFLKNNDLKDGTVVVANFQTEGKGRKNRKWVSSGKGIYFSLVLKPNIPVNEMLRFSLIFPLAIRQTILEYTETFIKWPNDIYLSGKKLSGILIESEIEAERIDRVVIGIGININDTEEDLKEVKDIATSLFIETGKTYYRPEIFGKLLNKIEEYYISYLTDLNFRKGIVQQVEKFLLWKGEKVVLIDDKQKIEGTLRGLNTLGGIVLDTEKSINEIYSGDLSLRKK